jgi:hypothetical protein
MAKDFLDEIADKMGIEETIECDAVLRWDGTKLYVVENFFRAGHKSRTQERDVTKEIAETIAAFLK